MVDDECVLGVGRQINSLISPVATYCQIQVTHALLLGLHQAEINSISQEKWPIDAMMWGKKYYTVSTILK